MNSRRGKLFASVERQKLVENNPVYSIVLFLTKQNNKPLGDADRCCCLRIFSFILDKASISKETKTKLLKGFNVLGKKQLKFSQIYSSRFDRQMHSKS